MVTITKPGAVPNKKIFATCRSCRTEFTFDASEAHYNTDQRDGDFYSILCPLPNCDETVRVTVRSGKSW